MDSNEKALVSLVLTRDSVCMGDDIKAPHEERVEVPLLADPVAFVRRVAAGYLPSVAGVGHVWTCVLNDVPVAKTRFLSVQPLVSALPLADVNRVHFLYHAASY